MESSNTQAEPHRQNRPQRHSRHNNRPRRAAASPTSNQQQITSTSGRAFGGHLTEFHAEAPAFVPASLPPAKESNRHQPQNPRHTNSSNSQPQIRKPRKQSVSRSTAPDIATRTHEDIASGIYECAICTNEIARNSKVWSCHTCWTVFHIGCIKRWSKNEGSAVHNSVPPDNDEAPSAKQWRCPGCNLPQESYPSVYLCWCEKELDPKSISGLPPHSCGQTCGKERKFPKSCPHPCDLICHAGPCPPCSAIGPKKSCYCGKEETRRQCIETNYESGWNCGSPCGDIMPCGDHTCQRSCHQGLCGACETEIDAQCYCGKVKKSLQCNQKLEEKSSGDWVGCLDCHQTCDNLMDCGIHRCEKTCHPQDLTIPHCPQSPDIITHCPCGKVALLKLQSEPRTKCTDPIPSCNEPCGKSLTCGHLCQKKCHTEACPPCLLQVELACRCGRNTFTTICYQGNKEPPQCVRTCKANLNCGRHECGDKCCTGERKAIERQATKRKLKPLGAVVGNIDDTIEPEHICTRVCGRKLRCSNHECPELCHRGACHSCKEAIFDDISCDCGRTVLQAPLPCGTKPPPCNFPCHRSKDCGHPQVAHNCHLDDENCPKCPFLTEKGCLCGKKALKNQPCWRSDVLCGIVCGKTLRCGSHTCRKTCHRPGECEDAHERCQQDCGKAKKICGHPCELLCHAPSACKEDKPCPFRIMITCDCQRKKEEVKCNARANASDAPGRQTSLKCDEECARLERNRNLARALHISDDHSDDHVPYSTATLNIYLEDIGWSHKQEEILRLFAADDKQKRYRFPPMKSRQRAFMHSISEDFGFDCESLDPEPHRHVLLFKTPKFVTAPMKTLAQAARIKRAQLNISAPVTSSNQPRTEETKHRYNGFLLRNPKFALTEDQVRPLLTKAAPTTDFGIVFLPAEDAIALIPARSTKSPDQLTTLLTSLQPTISSETSRASLAAAVSLCQFDLSGSEPLIIHQQGKQNDMSTSGWSQVAAKKAAPTQAPQVKAVGQRPVYTVLGSRLAEAKKKKEENEDKLRRMAQEEVVEDWEKEVEKEEL